MGLGSMVAKVVGQKTEIKKNAMEMVGGALVGAGSGLLMGIPWLDSGIKRIGAIAIVGLVGAKIGKRFSPALAAGIPGGAGALIGMQLVKSFGLGGLGALMGADGEVYDRDVYNLSDAAVEERMLSAGGAFADSDVDESPSLSALTSIIG